MLVSCFIIGYLFNYLIPVLLLDTCFIIGYLLSQFHVEASVKKMALFCLTDQCRTEHDYTYKVSIRVLSIYFEIYSDINLHHREEIYSDVNLRNHLDIMLTCRLNLTILVTNSVLCLILLLMLVWWTVIWTLLFICSCTVLPNTDCIVTDLHK